jgi:hypothetical protein
MHRHLGYNVILAAEPATLLSVLVLLGVVVVNGAP